MSKNVANLVITRHWPARSTPESARRLGEVAAFFRHQLGMNYKQVLARFSKAVG